MKLYCDLNDHIIDDTLHRLIMGRENEENQKNYSENTNHLIYAKASFRVILKYTESSHFGDQDIIGHKAGLSPRAARDTVAIGEVESTLFVMSADVL